MYKNTLYGYEGTLIQNIKTKPNYKTNKLIDVNKDEWIKLANHHEPIISKDKFAEVQNILNRKTKVNKNDDIDLFSGYLKCSHCGSGLIIKKSKNQIYYYCSSYIKYKSCLKYSINKKKLEQIVKDEIIKKINIEQLDRKTLNELIDIENIYKDIKEKIIIARGKMLKHIDTTMTEVYWYVGKITYELSNNSTKASYGKQIIDALSSRLTNEFGSGFSPVSIRRMRKFYEIYPIWSAVPTELSWSHFQELIRVDRKEEREFYENESIKSNWGYRELGRQINTKLYDRYLISPDKDKILLESKKGLIEKQPEELLKNPYIFEFAGLRENKNYLETDLEKALLSHLTEFLLELGRGFSFVASQQRLKIGSEYYYPDLVFYND